MNEKINRRSKQLTSIFNKIKQLDDNELSHLYELVSLHNEALFIVADLFAEAKFVRDEAYRERKMIEANTKLETNGTGVVKEATAELAVQSYRRLENDADKMYSKYRYYYDALDHRLVDYRQKRNKLEEEMKLINDR